MKAVFSAGLLIALLFLLLSATACNTALNPPQAKARTLDVLARFQQLNQAADVADQLRVVQQRAVEPASWQQPLLDWGFNHPHLLKAVFEEVGNAEWLAVVTEEIVRQGKSFLLLEKLLAPGQDGSQDSGVLANLIIAAEHRDHRRKPPAHETRSRMSKQRIAQLLGEEVQLTRKDGTQQLYQWQGAAMLVAESRCQLALATAGHNLVSASGQLRANLESFELQIAGRPHSIKEVLHPLPPSSLAGPENDEQQLDKWGQKQQLQKERLQKEWQQNEWAQNDWAVLVVDKSECGREYAVAELKVGTNISLPEQGAEVELHCFHQGRSDIVEQLYREHCRLYPTGADRMSLYADQPPGLLGIHGCISENGSSGCPLLQRTAEGYRLIALQIEGDSVTGAGIARLVSFDFAAAVDQVKARFVLADRLHQAGITPLSG